MSGRVLGGLLALLVFAGGARGQVPSFPDVGGWTLEPDTAVYTPESLYHLIDGAADIYLRYGFVDLHQARYRRADSMEVRVEVYREDTEANAFGIYAAERKPDYHFLAVGAQGYSDEGVLNFLAAPYYVKLSSDASGTGVPEALVTIAQAVAARLGPAGGFPAALRLFPPEGKIANSETYVADDFLGYRALRGAYVAQYQGFEMFIIPLADSAAARSMLTQYLAAIQQPAGRAGASGSIVQDPNNGPVGMVLHGKYLAGTANLADEGRIMSELARLGSRVTRP